jgi:hypothetical protein
MGRYPIGTVAMTPTERQRRRRAKLRETVYAEQVLANLQRDYARAGVNEQPAIRAGVKKLMRRWEKDAAAYKRAWRQRLGDRAPMKVASSNSKQRWRVK